MKICINNKLNYRINLHGRICQEKELSEPLKTNLRHKKWSLQIKHRSNQVQCQPDES